MSNAMKFLEDVSLFLNTREHTNVPMMIDSYGKYDTYVRILKKSPNHGLSPGYTTWLPEIGRFKYAKCTKRYKNF